MWISDMLDVSVPKEMLPEDIYSFFFNDNGATMMVVKFKDTSASASTMNALKQIKKLLKENCFIGGMSAILQDTKALVDQEIDVYKRQSRKGSIQFLQYWQ